MSNFLLALIAALLFVIASPGLVVGWFILTGKPDLVAFLKRISDGLNGGES